MLALLLTAWVFATHLNADYLCEYRKRENPVYCVDPFTPCSGFLNEGTCTSGDSPSRVAKACTGSGGLETNCWTGGPVLCNKKMDCQWTEWDEEDEHGNVGACSEMEPAILSYTTSYHDGHCFPKSE